MFGFCFKYIFALLISYLWYNLIKLTNIKKGIDKNIRQWKSFKNIITLNKVIYRTIS